MSKNNSHLETPLLEEDSYNGRVFHLGLPETGELNFGWLKDELENTSKTINSQNETKISERDDLHVPPIFESGAEGEAQLACIPQVVEFHEKGINGVIASLTHNKSRTVKFDGKEILTFDKLTSKFLIFESEGQVFLLLLTSRKHISKLYDFISDTLKGLGFIVEEIRIDSAEFEAIADDLIDTHLMTTIDEYEESSIHKKHIVGRDYGSAEEYQREKRQGAINGQRFGTSQLDASSKTIQISADCLVRSYHNLTLSMYLSMITSYIIPNISLSVQTSISAYSSNASKASTDHIVGN